MTSEEIYLGLTILAALVGTIIVWNDISSPNSHYHYVDDEDEMSEDVRQEISDDEAVIYVKED